MIKRFIASNERFINNHIINNHKEKRGSLNAWNWQSFKGNNSQQMLWSSSRAIQTKPCIICSAWLPHQRTMASSTRHFRCVAARHLWNLQETVNTDFTFFVLASSHTMNSKCWVFLLKTWSPSNANIPFPYKNSICTKHSSSSYYTSVSSRRRVHLRVLGQTKS